MTQMHLGKVGIQHAFVYDNLNKRMSSREGLGEGAKLSIVPPPVQIGGQLNLGDDDRMVQMTAERFCAVAKIDGKHPILPKLSTDRHAQRRIGE